jgi:toxin YoeB
VAKTPRSVRTTAAEHARSNDREVALIEKRFRMDFLFWVSTEPRIALRILKLIEEVIRTPFQGTGKPEPLKYEQQGMWARRITEEHRLTYYVVCDRICFAAARFHYG